jgi:class 3 adenylate cyclase/tetratricopeptide (TPR) repeat protein
MDVADWLRTLGLGQYEAAFRENSVTTDLLLSLTPEDLKDLGITAVGHRRRLLDAIAALRAERAARDDSDRLEQSQASGAASDAHASSSTAERRQLSVMFCDVIGFTALSSRLDPEELSAVIRGYQARVATTVTRFGGFIARYVGDGVLIYFGWPQAHETDAERAVRAALAVVEVLAQAPVRTDRLQVRIGIATGLVVVGEPIGTGEARQQTAIGETPNLAARLQNLAGPNSIVIDAVTRRLIGGLFDCRDLGTFVLKGLLDPVPIWQVLAGTSVESRFEALRAGTMTPLVGREEELDLLLRRWAHAKSGDGRVVLLSGEPGIGKSRLMAELEQCLASEPHESLRYFCSPHHQESALYPVIVRWEQEAGFVHGDTDEERRRKLEAVLVPAGTLPEDLVLIADLLSVSTGDRYQKLEFGPERKKEKTFAVLIRRLIARARQQPLLMLLEDAHWADPSSLELLDNVIRLVAELPVLLVVSFRPEFAAPWIGQAGVTLLALSRLDRRHATQLATQVNIEHRLTPALLERVVAQTDGVPLFIEELTMALAETAAQPDGATLAVPDTLQASLIARLDRLPAAKQVAQIGAVIGREFPHALLAAVARLPEAELVRGLDGLVASGLVFRRGVPPDAIYSFKHALVQEAAYDNLLRTRRADIHARIVAAAEADASIASIGPDVLGYHCTEAGLIAKAANYYRIAGQRPATRLAVSENRAQLERALHMAARLPVGRDRDRLEAELLLALAGVLTWTRGFGSAEAADFHLQAAKIGRKLDSPDALTRALFSQSLVLQNRGDLQSMQAIGDELLSLSETYTDAQINIFARMVFCNLAYQQGRFVTAREVLSGIVPWGANGNQMQVPLLTTGTDAVGMATVYPVTLACLGYIEEAVAQAGLAVEWARKRAPAWIASTIGLSSRALLVIRDDNSFRANVEEQVAISEELGFPYWLALGRCSLGWIIAKQGDIARGLGALSEALASLDAMGIQLHGTWTRALMADALTWAGRRSDAMATLDDALAHSARFGIAWFDAELHRRKGELLLADPQAAEQELCQAIDIARIQSAKLFELRAAVNVARLWSHQGKRPEARNLLAPIRASFIEGFDMPDLREANTLLLELAA